MFLVDSHCHLDLLTLPPDDSIEKVINRAKQNGVHYFLNVCVSLKEFPVVLNTAEAYPCVNASVGSHPNESDEEVTEENLLALGAHQKVIAIGETGLDYFRSTGDLEWQRDRFRTHIRVAKKLQKPLIIHTRDAKEDTIRLMREEHASEAGGVMHCFTEDWAVAEQALEMGFYISFSGIVTFKSAVTIQEVARKVPLDRMLVETDSPYLAPVPYRGQPNEPGYVLHTAEFIANLRNIHVDELAEQTSKNFFNLFKGAVRPYV